MGRGRALEAASAAGCVMGVEESAGIVLSHELKRRLLDTVAKWADEQPMCEHGPGVCRVTVAMVTATMGAAITVAIGVATFSAERLVELTNAVFSDTNIRKCRIEAIEAGIVRFASPRRERSDEKNN